ncbi:MAG TPA: hypothetical protein DIT13_15280 [Verrucomicrobiales bacterium]|nr:hypothetical protein [Verrucomicrobiales bacterium]HRJ08678.1 hypothetical protein [Prosthecobacter sp.]HRK14007.1 hypothetical protein [Prosthecobacter sp.]
MEDLTNHPSRSAAAAGALAEWRTESFALKAGWNAIYPHVDSSHATLDTLLAAYPDVHEVWRWQPERVDPREPGDVNAPPARFGGAGGA